MNIIKISTEGTSNKTINMTNSFLLRGISPSNLINSYYNGEFQSINIPDIKTKISECFINPDRIIGTNTDSEFYKFSDKIGMSQTIITTNHPKFIWCKHGCKDIPPTIICMNNKCKKVLSGHCIGIPISMNYNNITKKYIYYIDGSYCSFECCVIELHKFLSCNFNYKDNNYVNSEYILNTLYKQLYPNEPSLNKSYNTHPYIEKPNITLIPVKRQYVKMPVYLNYKSEPIVESKTNIKLQWINDNNKNECQWCSKSLHDVKTIIGIPVRMEYDNKSSHMIFYLKGYFCKFECCLSQLRRYESSNTICRNLEFVDCEYLLHLLYKKLYPNSPILHESPDWRLICNGPLTEQEYSSRTYQYTDIKSLVYTLKH